VFCIEKDIENMIYVRQKISRDTVQYQSVFGVVRIVGRSKVSCEDSENNMYRHMIVGTFSSEEVYRFTHLIYTNTV